MSDIAAKLNKSGFNRNILGCKDKRTYESGCHVNDLIETYWDVKTIPGVVTNGTIFDLIETYWDVKSTSIAKTCAISSI